jgi:hypothetical protein
MCPARQKAQEYSEGLSSIFNAAWREKIPFEAVYPYADTPKGTSFAYNPKIPETTPAPPLIRALRSGEKAAE